MKKIIFIPAIFVAASVSAHNFEHQPTTSNKGPNIPYVTTFPNNNTLNPDAINSANREAMADQDQSDLATGVGSTNNTANSATGNATANTTDTADTAATTGATTTSTTADTADSSAASRPMDEKRMSAGKRLTPPDQARGSKRDVELTRRIRELLMKDSTLSTEAQNVKIITLGGVATLSGEVETSEERTKVLALARQVVGSSSVRNDLQVEQQ